MKLLLISALAATLMGCTYYTPQQASLTGCTCSDGAAGTPQMNSKPVVLHSNSKTEKAIAAKEGTRHRRKANTHTKNASFAYVVPVRAQTLTTEPDAKQLSCGQKVLVENHTCPAGQILEVTGSCLDTKPEINTVQSGIQYQNCIKWKRD